MMFKRYESYKESGVEWLGEIPVGWEHYRLDWISTIIRGNTGFKKDELLTKGEYIALQYGKTYKVDEVNESFNFFVNSEFYKSSQVVHFGDTIVVSTSETIEDLGHSYFYNRNDVGLIGGEQILLKPNKKLTFDKFLYYSSKVFCIQVRKYATGLKVFRFNTDNLKVLISMPSAEEQESIATYLDQKTQAIDKEIRLLEQKIASYKTLKQTLINETVLRGLDKNRPLKESGVAWIGKIPVGWEINRIGTAFQERSTKVSDKDYRPLSVTQKGIVPQLENVAKTMHNDNRKLVLKGDFVINSRSDRRGSSGIAEEDGSVSVINIVLQPRKHFYGKYLHHLFRSYAFIEEFFRHGRGIAYDLWTTKYSVMKAIDFAYPSIAEQDQIANYLDEKTKTIESITQTIEQKISLLKELRKTLINDVVTGKIKVA